MLKSLEFELLELRWDYLSNSEPPYLVLKAKTNQLWLLECLLRNHYLKLSAGNYFEIQTILENQDFYHGTDIVYWPTDHGISACPILQKKQAIIKKLEEFKITYDDAPELFVAFKNEMQKLYDTIQVMYL